MSGWIETFYRFKPRQDDLWFTALSRLPRRLAGDIEFDFGRVWLLRASTRSRVALVLAHGDQGVRSLTDGALVIPDELRVEVLAKLRDWGCRGRWWTIRRCHLRSTEAQLALDAALQFS